jgi:hypothetical protein
MSWFKNGPFKPLNAGYVTIAITSHGIISRVVSEQHTQIPVALRDLRNDPYVEQAIEACAQRTEVTVIAVIIKPPHCK